MAPEVASRVFALLRDVRHRSDRRPDRNSSGGGCVSRGEHLSPGFHRDIICLSWCIRSTSGNTSERRGRQLTIFTTWPGRVIEPDSESSTPGVGLPLRHEADGARKTVMAGGLR